MMPFRVSTFLFLSVIFGTLQSACSKAPEKPVDTVAESVEEKAVPSAKKPVILFFGDSITAGYGLDANFAFPALIQARLDSLGYAYNVVNGGLSGETSAGGLRRIDWVLRAKPEIFMLELGGNDGLRGVELTQSKENLKAIIAKVRAVNPDVKVIIAGMQIPPNLGPDYANQFKNMFPELAKSENAALIPFLLDGVGGDPKLNLPDMIHPNKEGHQILAETVWKVVGKLVQK